MRIDQRVWELLSRWRELRDLGQEASVEELCSGRPELEAPLANEIQATRTFESPLHPETVDFQGNPAEVEESGDTPDTTPVGGRYEILGELGRGGMGVVWRARDRRTDQTLALKTMKRPSGASLDLFKKEFRYLQGVSHPNLVQLYDLESDGLDWILTMELVEGVDFMSHVRPSADQSAVETGPLPLAAAVERATSSRGLPPLHTGRLREALGQLAEGIAALHAFRRVHRDLKPRNVQVTPQGRVVVLDFGLAAVLGPMGEHRRPGAGIAGTLPYMAPEQLGDPPVSSPASDCYSLGVMLYQAMTGRLPHSGTFSDLLRDKRAFDPPPPRSLSPEVPSDLDDLCMALLRRRPAERPTAAEILERLGRGAATPPDGTMASEDVPLLGRRQQLSFLEEAYEDSRLGRAVCVAVHGPSGVGKSALVGHFLDRLRARGNVVLAGRCYEHESVPYKALDPLVDELGEYLRGLPEEAVTPLLPQDMGPLTRVFPVLENLAGVADVDAGPRAPSDPSEMRRRAFAALRLLLARAADHRPVVLHIDDLQWGDVDSAQLLADLLRPPDPPPLLLLTSYRSEDTASPCLRALAESLGRSEGVVHRELVVPPLTDGQVSELVNAMMGAGAVDRAASIARESGGNPFFVTELVREIRSSAEVATSGSAGHETTLEVLIRKRVGRLSNDARRLLEVVALSGRPLGEAEALRAADIGAEGRTVVARLESGRFIRGTGPSAEICLETYHDRIRESVAAGLTTELRRNYHGRLAQVLEESGRDDPEVLAGHFEGAGESNKAGMYFSRAADRATRTLAFDHAANLYRRSLDLRPVDGVESRELRTKLADALANAGRGVEAAPVYLGVAEGSEAVEAMELRRRAADQLLLSGQTSEGMAALGTLLNAVGLRLAGGPRRALLTMLWERARLQLGGLDFREQAADSIPAQELLRIDASDTAGRRLCMVDVGQALLFRARFLRLALRAGEPSRIPIGLAMNAVDSVLGGGRPRDGAEKTLRRAFVLAERVDSPFALSGATVLSAIHEWALGRWEDSLTLVKGAENIAAEREVSIASERTWLEHFSLDCLHMLGEWREIGRRLPAILPDALRRGDRFSASILFVHSYVAHLAADRPAEAEQDLRRAVEEWPQSGFFASSYWVMYGGAEVALYRGEGRRSRELLLRQWPAVCRSTFVIYIQVLFILMIHLRARTALAAAEGGPPGRSFFGSRARLLRSAARDAWRIERRRIGWAKPLAQLIRAGIAFSSGQRGDAVELLTEAEAGFGAADMRMFMWAARRRRGQLLGGEEGRALVNAADSWMTAQAVHEPPRVTDMLVPGFGPSIPTTRSAACDE